MSAWRYSSPAAARIWRKTILAQNQYTGFTVKILNQYTPFLARVEGLENIAVVEQEDTKAREQEIRNLILNISM